MKEAIQKAIEGGYLKSPYEKGIREFSSKGFWMRFQMPAVMRVQGRDVFPSDTFYSYSETFLDPLFWEALVGKDLALTANKAFVEHLHKRKEAEEFFKQLLK